MVYTVLIVGLIIWALLFLAPPTPRWLDAQEKREHAKRHKKLPNTLAPKDDPWHPDNKGS